MWWLWNIVDYSIPWLPTNISHGEILRRISGKQGNAVMHEINMILGDNISEKRKKEIMRELHVVATKQKNKT